MAEVKLSVVMTNYNHSKYIAEALDCIVNQTFKSFEVIVCDDGSTDNSVEIIQKFVDKYPFVRLIKNDSNLGIFGSISRLIPLVVGDYLYIAAADDKILPRFFEKSIELLVQYPKAGLCSTGTLCIDMHGRNKGILHLPIVSCKSNFIPSDKALSLLYKHGSWMQGNTAIFRTKALLDNGGFIPELHSFCDGFLHYVLAVKYGVCFIPEPLTMWRKLKDSYSATITRDPETSLQWISQAKKLMRTTYSNLFPADFINSWEKRELINFFLLRSYNLQNDMLDDLKRLNPTQSLMDCYFFRFRKLLLKIDYFNLKFYLYRRAKLFANELIIQKIKSFLVSIYKR